MAITIKNLKYSAFASHETHCFEASVYLDGKKIGEVRNQGFGGPDDWSSEEARITVERYAATLPAVTHTYGGNAMEAFIPDAEYVICEAVNVALATKELKRKMASKTVFYDDFKVWEMKSAPERVLAKYPKAQVFNTMPLDAAVAFYRRAMR